MSNSPLSTLVARRVANVILRGVAALALSIAGLAVVAGSAGAAPLAYCSTITNAVCASGTAVVEQGSTTTIYLTGKYFAYDNGPVSITTTAPGVTITSAAETSTTRANASFATTSATLPGYYAVTITDDNGSVTLANGLGIFSGPTITSVSPSSLAPAVSGQTVQIAGTGFSGTEKVVIVDALGDYVTSGIGAGQTANVVSSTLLTVVPANTATSPAGTYNVTVIDSNSVASNTGSIVVGGLSITGVTPSNGLIIPAAGTSTQPVTISGSGFEPGATVTLSHKTTETISAITEASVASTLITTTTPDSGSTFTATTITIANTKVVCTNVVAGQFITDVTHAGGIATGATVVSCVPNNTSGTTTITTSAAGVVTATAAASDVFKIWSPTSLTVTSSTGIAAGSVLADVSATDGATTFAQLNTNTVASVTNSTTVVLATALTTPITTAATAVTFTPNSLTAASTTWVAAGQKIIGSGIPAGTVVCSGWTTGAVTLCSSGSTAVSASALETAGTAVYFVAAGGTTDVTVGTPSVTNSGLISLNVTVPTGYTPASQLTALIINPDATQVTSDNLLGVGQAGAVSSSATPAITSTNNTGTLHPGPNTVVISTTDFPLAVGNTVTLKHTAFSAALGAPVFTLTGTVVKVVSTTAYISVVVPEFVTTTLASAAAAGATTLVLTNGLGIKINSALTIVDGLKSENVTSTNDAAGTGVYGTDSLTVGAITSAHAAGTVVQFPFPLASSGYTMSVNNGSSTQSIAVTIAANSDTWTQNFADAGNLSTTVGTVYKGSTIQTLLTNKGFGFAAGTTVGFINSSGISEGITGTVTATSADTATLAITIPRSYAAYTTPSAGMAIGDSQVTLTSVTNLAIGTSVTATNSAGQTQTFTVAGVSGSIVAFTTVSTYSFGTTSKWVWATIGSSSVSGGFNTIVTSPTGSVLVLSGLSVSASDAITFTGYASTSGVALTSLAAGAGTIDQQGGSYGKKIEIIGTGFTSNASYAITTDNPGVTFSHVSYVSSTVLYAYVNVGPTTAVTASVTVTLTDGLQGGVSLPSSSVGLPALAITAGPTVTSVVSSASSLSFGTYTTLTITGTGFSTTHTNTVYIIAGSGENAGAPDSGTASGAAGITCVGGAVSSTQIVCSAYIGAGASAGVDQVEVVDNVTGGTSALAGSLTIIAPAVTAVTPASIDNAYNGSTAPFTMTVAGMALNTTSVAGMTCTANTINGATGNETQVACSAVSLYTSTQVRVYLTAAPNAGEYLYITLTNASGQSFDAPVILVSASVYPTTIAVSPVVALVPGTTTNVTVTNSSADISNGRFFPSTSQLVYTGTGITSKIVSITPVAVVFAVTVAATATTGSFLIGEAVVSGLSLGTGPTITTPTATVNNFNYHAGQTASMVITGTGFVAGAMVAASLAGVATFGTAIVNAAGTTITVPVTFGPNPGPYAIQASLNVSNPSGYGTVTLTNGITLSPNPTVTGGPYYAPTASTTQVMFTGAGFQTGVTVKSFLPTFVPMVVNVSSTGTYVVVQVTTAPGAVQGATTTLTFTNPDGGVVTASLIAGTAAAAAAANLPLPIISTFSAVTAKQKSVSALSSNSKADLATLISSLNDGAQISVSGYGTTKAIALARANAVANYLFNNGAAVHITIKSVISKTVKTALVTVTVN